MYNQNPLAMLLAKLIASGAYAVFLALLLLAMCCCCGTLLVAAAPPA